MARFYGTVKGSRGEATRLGHATSGLTVTAQSYSGDVVVRTFVENDEDCVYIRARSHNDYGHDRLIYRGPIKKLLEQSARATMLKSLVTDMLIEG